MIGSLQERSHGTGSLQQGKPINRFAVSLKLIKDGKEAVGERK